MSFLQLMAVAIPLKALLVVVVKEIGPRMVAGIGEAVYFAEVQA